MNIAAFTPKQYNALKKKLRPYITSAVYYSDLTLKDVEDGIERRTHVPIAFLKGTDFIGLMVLELEPDAVHVTTLAGDFQREWQQEAFTALMTIAKSHDKHKIQLKGRKGWTRFLKPLGFKPVQNGYLEVAL